MAPILRFAPSPTGRLHLGNIRTALINWLYTRREGGELLLRIDDTDRERSREEYEAAIQTDLLWLGLNWDSYHLQSDRLDAYAAAADSLKQSGRLYPCFESAEELELKRKLALSQGKPPIYDRAALRLTNGEVAALIAEGQKPSWRLKLNPGPLAWEDLVRGSVRFEAEHMSDPILVRPDGSPVYMLASVVDDIAFSVTHIIRGEDHVANTAVQIQLFDALSGTLPAFGHFSLIADASGEKLSKRTGSSSIQDLRNNGIEAQAILSLLAKLGTSDPIELKPDLAILIHEFDIAKFGRNRPKLDEAELDHLNARLMHELDYASVRLKLPPDAGEDFWNAIRSNITRVSDAQFWWTVIRGPISPIIEDASLLRAAADLLPEGVLDGTTWSSWTNAIKNATGHKGKALFHPLRLALTAHENGPELAKLLPLIGRDRVVQRLNGLIS